MTDQEILEGNMLIANSPFSLEGLRRAIKRDVAAGKDDKYIYGNLKFHLSFDWTIGVINNILLAIYKSSYLQSRLKDNDAFVIRFGLEHPISISGINQQFNISSTFIKVVDFIKWYNKLIKS